MNTAKELRSDILEMLIKVEDIKLLEIIRNELKVIYKKAKIEKSGKGRPAFMEAVKPLRKNISLSQIMDEQNYKPCSYQEFRAVADDINWKEVPLKELLKSLK